MPAHTIPHEKDTSKAFNPITSMTQRDRKRLIIVTWVVVAALITTVSVFSIRDEAPGTRWMEALYTTMRMFVFERDLEKFPSSWPLVSVHFLAPLMTFSALGMIFTYLLRSSPSLRARLMRRHAVICGLARTGKLLCASLSKLGIRTVGIENHDAEPLYDWSLDHGVIFLHRDPHSLSALQLASYKRAKSIIFSDDDDFVNLDDALRTCDFFEQKKVPAEVLVWAHVKDNRLRENMLTALQSHPPGRIRLFDAFSIAARQMLKVHFSSDRRSGIQRITICGFGSFGRDLLEELILGWLPGEHPVLRVIDIKDVGSEMRQIETHMEQKVDLSFHCCDMRDFAEHTKTQDDVYFLCSDNDHGNLTAALSLARFATGTRIFVRMQHWPMTGVIGHFGSEIGIVFINIENLVSDGIAEWLELQP